ncbi:hypothetical protein SKAU_G00145680 [Synaphobranchus kaupii]|uniref:Uncharacterized protein n=1 Tax=Synaphobranchus kaupii TaxID=118154 RepID=A0A9Q1FT85_SYNKA|nr:hypothetical protein SKAU_G00145680 [Synaphobranchus kaupii]
MCAQLVEQVRPACCMVYTASQGVCPVKHNMQVTEARSAGGPPDRGARGSQKRVPADRSDTAPAQMREAAARGQGAGDKEGLAGGVSTEAALSPGRYQPFRGGKQTFSETKKKSTRWRGPRLPHFWGGPPGSFLALPSREDPHCGSTEFDDLALC